MAARGSERVADVLEELLVELSGRLRGGRARITEQGHGLIRALVDELNLVTPDDLDELELRVAQILEELLVELPGRLRGTRGRLSDGALNAVRALVDELDLVTKDDVAELELRVAQLEHRLRLLEGPPAR